MRQAHRGSEFGRTWAARARRAERRIGRLATAGAGMAAAYFLDPDKGPQRRRKALDALEQYWASLRRPSDAEDKPKARSTTPRAVRRAA
jgi:hypothetical protein